MQSAASPPPTPVRPLKELSPSEQQAPLKGAADSLHQRSSQGQIYPETWACADRAGGGNSEASLTPGSTLMCAFLTPQGRMRLSLSTLTGAL